MKLSALRIVLGVCALSGAMAATAQAEDFTIVVPVEVSNLPDNAQPQVHCRAIMDTDSNIIGLGHTDLPSNADFTGNVTVKFDLFESSEGITPAHATGYGCSLLLHPDAEHVVLSWERCEEVDRDPASNPLICGARGATVVGLVEGEF